MRLGGALFLLRERIAPNPDADLTPERVGLILSGVMTRIETDESERMMDALRSRWRSADGHDLETFLRTRLNRL